MKYALIYLILLSSFGLNAQHLLSGKVIDDFGTPISYASISVFSLPDSVLETGAVTDISGNFELDLSSGSKELHIRFLSFVPYVKQIDLKTDLRLSDIVLVEDALTLGEIEVEAERSLMTTKLDKRVFVVGKDLSSQGGSASDILDNVPSVNVDVEGNISLRGSQNVRILIDGKESGMISDGGAFLRQLPANMIKEIEVITNPSARYQADGESGIINIVFKKNNSKKVNGSFELSTGSPAKHGASYLINWRNKKIGLSSSYGIIYQKFKGSGLIEHNYLDSNEQDYNSQRNHQRGGLNHNIRLGLDWYSNAKNVVNLTALYNPRTADNGANIDYQFIEDSNFESFQTRREDVEKEEAQNIEFNLSHTKTLKNKDHKWTNLVSLSRRDDIEKNTITETSSNTNDVIEQDVSNREDAQTWIVQTDYVHPFSKDGRFELGGRISLRHIENEFLVTESLNEGQAKVLDNFDNLFDYNEDIYAGYFLYGNKSDRWSYQAGLRVEHSEISTDLVKTNEFNPKSYTNFFPSGLVSFEKNDLEEVQLSYSRRITRPRLWYLFPFFTFSDNRNLAVGNPDLDPELIHSLELSYLRKLETGNILAALVFRRGNDIIQRIRLQSDDGIIRSFPVNLSAKNAFGFDLNLNFKPLAFWKVNLNNYFAYEEISGSFEGTNLGTERLINESKLINIIDIGKKTDLQLTIKYDAPNKTPQGRRQSITFASIAISRKLFDNKANLTLSVQDVFNSRFRRNESFTSNFEQYSEFQWRQRQAVLTFIYRIGKENSTRRGSGRPR